MQFGLSSRPHIPGRRPRAGALLIAGFLGFGFLQATPAYAATPELSVEDARVVERDAVNATARVRVVLSAPATRRVTADFTTVNGTAKAGSDYVRTTGTVVIPKGRQAAGLTVAVLGDELDERNEYFRVRLLGASHADVDDAVGRVRILDNDPAPYLLAGDVVVTEPDSGVAVARFPVTLSEVSGRYVSVDYAVSGGTALADFDYVATEPTGTLEFPPGTTQRTVSIAVLADAVDEGDETVYLRLSDPTNSYVVDGTAVATIVDGEQPTISIGDVTVTEGQAATFPVRMSKAWNKAVRVSYSTAGVTATSGSDFYAASGYLTLQPGVTNATVTVFTIDDGTSENSETFDVNLSDAVNATIVDPSGRGTILDSDGVTVSVSDAVATEGQNAVFTVSLSRTSTVDVKVDWRTVTGTAGTADFTPASGTATVRAGSLSTTVSVRTTNDTVDEANETFSVTMSNPRGAVISRATGTGTILDDDDPSLWVRDVRVDEGDGAYVEVSLSTAAAQTVTFTYSTTDGTAKAADYTAVAPTAASIPAGTTAVWLPVKTTEDAFDEDDETFTLSAYNLVNARAGDTTATVVILDDDPLPTLSAADATVDKEGDRAVVTVKLSAPSGRVVTVAWATADGPSQGGAVSSQDYTAAGGTITFQPGETTKEVTVSTADDTADEEAEVFYVRLTNPSNATIAAGQATITISAND